MGGEFSSKRLLSQIGASKEREFWVRITYSKMTVFELIQEYELSNSII